jgi:5'-nucleotidase
LGEKFDKRNNGKDYYWLAGEFVNQDKGEDTDGGRYKMISYLLNPTFDLTAHYAIIKLNTWK